MKQRSKSGLYVYVQDSTDPYSFQAWPIHICPECGDLLMVMKTNRPTYCPGCDDGAVPFIPLDVEEGERPLTPVVNPSIRKAA